MTYQKLRALLTRRFHIPKERSIERAVRRFTLAEKALFYFFTGLFILSGVLLISRVNSSFLIDVPLRGGTVSEGIIGNPRFVNPVLAISEADKALVSLVYSGLMRSTPEGDLVEDLASKVEVSEDGLTYTVSLREDAVFHDGEPLSADDVIFTIQKILDPAVKSPLLGDFSGIVVSRVDDRTLTFTLRRPYGAFLESLAVGILPKHIWSSVTNDEFSFSQWNVLPIGSGPYRVEAASRDSGGIPDYYELTPFDRSVSGRPYVARYIFRFYPSEADLLDAYDSGDVKSLSGISPKAALELEEKGARIVSSPLPRVFGVFFNQNRNRVLLDKTVRQALNIAAPKEEIVETLLGGYGIPLEGPLPPALIHAYGEEGYDYDRTRTSEERLEEAKALLDANGWTAASSTGILEKKSKSGTLRLSLSLSTSDNPELRSAAQMLQSAWQKLGAEVSLSIYEGGDLNQNVIRPRRYEALLFGEVIGRDLDAYPFWHSSERNDPGLNIAMYANSRADKLLTDARAERDPEERREIYEAFEAEIANDVPAVFLYSPNLIYVIPESVKGAKLERLGATQDRFLGVRDWYIETNSVWNIFANR